MNASSRVLERARLWLKRHRAAVLASVPALAVLAVVAPLLLSASRNRRAARHDAEAQRRRAEDGFRLAQDAAAALLRQAEDVRPAPGTPSRLLARILGQANDQYDELLRIAGERPAILLDKARLLTALSE